METGKSLTYIDGRYGVIPYSDSMNLILDNFKEIFRGTR